MRGLRSLRDARGVPGACRLYEELINKRNQAGLEELIATNFADHNSFPGQAPGLDGVKQVFTMMTTAFPDMHMTVEDQIAEGDKVVSRVTVPRNSQR